MKVQDISVSKVNPAPYNPRKDLKPDDPEYRKLLKSMETFGCVQPLVWNRRSGALVGGHQRFKILIAQGAKTVPVVVVDLSPEREKALNLALNRISGDWDRQQLAVLLDELTSIPEFDLDVTGFDAPEVERLLDDFGCGNDEEDFDVGAALADAAAPVTQPGELIKLGDHRVLCGDAQRADDLKRLLDGHTANLLWTDPPYGVSYTGENRPVALCRNGKKKAPDAGWQGLRNDQLSPAKYRSWFRQTFKLIVEALTPGAPFYIWHSHRRFGLLADLLPELGLRPSQVITWAKESFSPGFGDFQEQTEFCMYGWNRGAKHRFFGPANASTLWSVHRDRTQSYRHPTQKPLELAERAIRYSSRTGEIVFDPFLGSGTALIAAARQGRRCLGLEIEPAFCDVIVRRFIALVGRSGVSSKLYTRYMRTEPKHAANKPI
jgi:DNA modification methylase